MTTSRRPMLRRYNARVIQHIIRPYLIYSACRARIMGEMRLGDVIDDHCIKCRRITNHSIVSLVDGAAAKVRCRTCYHDHDYRHEQPPPSKKDLKKAELFNQVLANAGGATDGAAADAPVVVPVDGTPVDGTSVEDAPVETAE